MHGVIEDRKAQRKTKSMKRPTTESQNLAGDMQTKRLNDGRREFLWTSDV